MARLRVRVQPGAKRDEIVGFSEGVLKVKVAAPAIEGRANVALTALLARSLGVRKSDVTIVTGASSRTKLVEIAGLDEVGIHQRLNSA